MGNKVTASIIKKWVVCVYGKPVVEVQSLEYLV